MAFEDYTARLLSIENPRPQVVASHALEMRVEWSKSTWRQYKAALTFRFRAMGSPDSLEAVDMLRDGHQSPCATKTRRTSGRRAKNVSTADLRSVVHRIQASKSQYATILVTWLLLGAEVGLRPHEWGQARVVYVMPQDVGDEEAESTTPLPYLQIRNAKGTNGRTHGEYRHLNLSRLSPAEVKVVADFCKFMSSITAGGSYKRYYSACVKLLYRVNRELHENDDKRWVQLYSPRHRFSAEAKRMLGEEGVAALMGHGTTKTAARHYGRRITATGSLGPRPVAAEIARVRKIRGYQSGKVGPAPLESPTPGAKQSKS